MPRETKQQEIERLKAQLAEAEETLRAIQSGEVDALIVTRPEGQQLYTLEGAEKPHRLLVEAMNEGAMTLNAAGTVLYGNARLAEMARKPLEQLMGSSWRQLLPQNEHASFESVLEHTKQGGVHAEHTLLIGEGQSLPVHVSASTVDLLGTKVFAILLTDISTLKKAERQLRQSYEQLEIRVQERTAELRGKNEFLENLISNASIGVAVVDRNMRYLVANASYQTITRTPPAIVGKSITEVFPPDLAQVVQSNLQKVFQSAEPLHIPEYEVVLAGKRSCSNVSNIPLRDAAGGVEAVLILIQEVTERKLAEEALRASQEQFRIVAENAQAVFGIVQGKKFVWANPYLTEISGYSLDEIVSMDFMQMVHPDFKEQIADYARRRQLGEPVPTHYEFAMVTKTGETRWMDFSPGRIEYKGRPAIVGTAYDITARKKAEEQLRDSERRFRSLFENSPDAVFMTIPDGKVIAANPAACAMFGMTEEEICRVGHSGLVDRTDPRHATLLAERRRTGLIANKEASYVRKNGAKFPAEVSSVVLPGEPQHSFVILRDISKRKEAEERLQKSEERYQRMFEDDLTGDFIASVDGRILLCNPAFARIFGFASAKEAIGTSMLDLYPDKGERELVVQRLKRERKVEREGCWRQRRDGHSIYIVQNLVGHFNAQGELFEIKGYIYDDTERKQAENTLRASEERFRAFFDLSASGASEVDVQTNRFVSANEKFCEITGYSCEELRQKSFLDITHPDDRAMHAELHAKLMRGELKDYNLEKRYIRKDGQTIWGAISIAAARDASGNVVRGIGILNDITERKRAEEALRFSEEKFATAFAGNPAGLVITRLEDGLCLDVNNTFLSLCGYSREELLGHPARELPIWPSREDTRRFIQELRQRGFVHAWEQQFRRKTGELFILQVSAQIMILKGEQVILWTGIDITERKHAEEQLQRAKEDLAQANAGLEQKVHERTAKLKETVEELEQFSYAITHDMRAPLRAMHGFSRVLLNECRECLHGERRETLRRIADAATRMDELITDSLNYSKIVSQRFDLEPVDLKLLLEGVVETYPEFHPHKADIKIEGDIPILWGNKAGLTQCCSNLLSNAVKFVETGKVPQIRISAEMKGEYVRLNFKDNGLGIPKQYQEQIWEMFQILSKEYEGTGIGLAIVRKIVQRMGGKVGVESEPGQGSCFWLELKRYVP